MKASNYTDTRKAFIIKQGEDGTPLAEICRKAGNARATSFNCRGKYPSPMPSQMKQPRELANEPRRFGYRRLGILLLAREGFEVNHKKLFRLHFEEGPAK